MKFIVTLFPKTLKMVQPGRAHDTDDQSVYITSLHGVMKGVQVRSIFF